MSIDRDIGLRKFSKAAKGVTPNVNSIFIWQIPLFVVTFKHKKKKKTFEIQEKKNDPSWKARRWVVEVSHSWFNRFRKILVRYEKLADTYLALLHFAAAIIAYRKANVIYG